MATKGFVPETGYGFFPNRFGNSCRICGASLSINEKVYGKKDDLSNRWTIICGRCHDGIKGQAVKRLDKSGSSGLILEVPDSDAIDALKKLSKAYDDADRAAEDATFDVLKKSVSAEDDAAGPFDDDAAGPFEDGLEENPEADVGDTPTIISMIMEHAKWKI